jgi:hypothetical protein
VRNFVHDLTEADKKRRFSDYHLVPEYNRPSNHGPTKELSKIPQDTGGD